jgi:hypothetical protein
MSNFDFVAFTPKFIYIATALILLYDLIAWHYEGNKATISFWFWTQTTTAGVVVGFVLGHLLWQVKDWYK